MKRKMVRIAKCVECVESQRLALFIVKCHLKNLEMEKEKFFFFLETDFFFFFLVKANEIFRGVDA